ncbi:MAG: Putative ribosomal pseudouridine synthase [uncultured Sulfurovum sp.]|uniref:RNA pseudouridylate synthase n=1 Tax=uncultured Sulfurovum sp. TaxID=269237 RepID=A0A6S6U279_9BACT|nr:MAG: Putative ribosomal pseudouridine synthase [uncultured Sulfurovum sp.]
MMLLFNTIASYCILSQMNYEGLHLPYVLKQYDVLEGKDVANQKVEDFLVEVVKLSETLALKLLQKGRIYDNHKKRLQKGKVLKSGYIEVLVFEPITKGLKPLFQTEHFALFDKPSGLLVHPTIYSTKYTLLDEVRYQFGEEGHLVHRIDAETSGLVLVSKNGYAHYMLQEMFVEKAYVKKYKAFVEKELKEELLVEKKIMPSHGIIKLKMQTSPKGKASSTLIRPLFFDKAKNQTLVEAIPYTGRQHQIRVHLDSLSHRIVGDPIYGLDEHFVDDFLNDRVEDDERLLVTGESRLMLHAYYLEFTFLHTKYIFCSKQTFGDD